MTCTLWINTYNKQSCDTLVRFDEREDAVHFTRQLFDKYAENVVTATKEGLSGRTYFDPVDRSDFSVWNPTSVLFPGLGTDCATRVMGSGEYMYDFPLDRMRNRETKGYFVLAWIRGADFEADIYLADDGFVPAKTYLNEVSLLTVENYKRIAHVDEFDAFKMLLGGTTVYCAETDWELFVCPDVAKGENNVLSYFRVNAEEDVYDFRKLVIKG